MDSSDLRRRFVQLLLDWATAPPDAREPKRELMRPTNDFWPWLYGMITRCYRPSLNRFWGVTEGEFRDGCVQKIFAWVKENIETLGRSDFTDARLAALVRALARNECISLWRRMRKWRSLQPYLESPAGAPDQSPPMRPSMPAGLCVQGEDSCSGHYEGLQEEFLQACRVMPSFHQSLRGKRRMRQLLALLLRLGRRMGRKRGFPAYWYTYRLLRQRNQHLPVYLRGFLKHYLPHLEYTVINSRLGYLRRAFNNFLL